MIFIANVCNAVLTLGMAIYFFAVGTIFGGVLLLVAAVLQLLWVFFSRRHIAFSAELLRMATHVVRKFKMLLVVNLGLTVISFVYVVLWFGALIPSADRAYTDRLKGADYFLFLLLAFTLFWATQVIPNIMHTTTAGVTATWYFVGSAKLVVENGPQTTPQSQLQTHVAIPMEAGADLAEKDQLDVMSAYALPPTVTLKSLSRAVTTSFGSICFGSLLVAIIQFITFLVRSGQNSNDSSACMTFLRCVAICLLNMLENLVRFFNRHAFVYVAMYGTGYIDSAKRTFDLLKNSFWEAWINDCLVGPTLELFAVVAAAVIGVVTGAALHGNVFIGLVAFFIALAVIYLFLTPIFSAVTTLFVCFAEMPEGLRQCNPALYRRLCDADAQRRGNAAAQQ
ncbi:hypothetical protein STCU_08228 [Strigomonas culicis]|nr:hypothetical protein STCU_08228 [Strigomonas culicis]|eukprot:EPY22345.1 hypothetical protein STCU_08228 [Strigomonas culicis]